MSTDYKSIAERLINAYISLIPNDPRALSHRIYILLINEDYLKVILESNKYLQKFKNDVSVLFHKGKSYGKLNQIKESI